MGGKGGFAGPDHIYIYVCMYIHTHVCMCMHVCTYMYICIYIYNIPWEISGFPFLNDVGLLYVPGDTCRSAVATALATLVSGGRRETPPRSPSATALSALSRPSSTGSGSHAVPREPWRNGDFMGFHGISWGVATKLFDS